MSVYPARSTAPAPAPTSRPSPTTIWLGLDVHKESVTIAVLRGDAPAPDRVDRLPNDLPKLKRDLERLAGQGPLWAVYDASGAGYVLHRACPAWGVPCDVIAPSLLVNEDRVVFREYLARLEYRRARVGGRAALHVAARSRRRATVTCGTCSSKRRGVIGTCRRSASGSRHGSRGNRPACSRTGGRRRIASAHSTTGSMRSGRRRSRRSPSRGSSWGSSGGSCGISMDHGIARHRRPREQRLTRGTRGGGPHRHDSGGRSPAVSGQRAW